MSCVGRLAGLPVQKTKELKTRRGVKNLTKSLVNIPSVDSKVKLIIFLNFSNKTIDWLKNFSYFALKSVAHQLVRRL
jgi:hypothetical protein